MNAYLLELIPTKIGFKEILAFINEFKQKQTKKFLIDDLSKILLELKFKQHNVIKSKSLKWIVKNILPKYKE